MDYIDITSQTTPILNSKAEKSTITQIIEYADRVYESLGPGHNERIYHKALVYELMCNNYNIDTEMNVVVKYVDSKGKSHNLESERIDIFIHDINIILELKAIQKQIQSQEICQIKKYFNELKKIGISVPYGIIINFPQPSAKEIPSKIESLVVNNDTDTKSL